MAGCEPTWQVFLTNGLLPADRGLPDLDTLFATLCTDPSKPVVLHFHGGLVDEASALGIAADLRRTYEDAGACPVFFIWHAGFMENLATNGQAILGDVVLRFLQDRVVDFLLSQAGIGGGGAKGLLGAGRADGDPAQAENALDHGVLAKLLKEHEQNEGDGYAVLEHDVPDKLPMAPQVRQALERGETAVILPPPEKATEDGAVEKGLPVMRLATLAVKVAVAVTRRYLAHRDHGLGATVREELLRHTPFFDIFCQSFWDKMKGDTADAFGDDALCGGTLFLKRLGEQLAATGRRVVLIGHSTGAVFICNLLEHARDLPEGFRFEVVFEAPACTFELFDEALRVAADRIGQVRLFGMGDERECADPTWRPEFYPRSLLYFVSGVCEPEVDMPILGMQRFHTSPTYVEGDGDEAAMVRRVREFFGQDGRCVWAEAKDGPGRENDTRHHGDQDNDPATLRSLQAILREGFVPAQQRARS